MSRQIKTAARLGAACFVLTAILASGAWAGRYSIPTGPPQRATPVATCHQYCDGARRSDRPTPATSHALMRTELVSTSAGFAWGDAAIGFSIGIGAMVLVLAIGTGSRRLRAANTAT
jgi:hypothetical protein